MRRERFDLQIWVDRGLLTFLWCAHYTVDNYNIHTLQLVQMSRPHLHSIKRPFKLLHNIIHHLLFLVALSSVRLNTNSHFLPPSLSTQQPPERVSAYSCTRTRYLRVVLCRELGGIRKRKGYRDVRYRG